MRKTLSVMLCVGVIFVLWASRDLNVKAEGGGGAAQEPVAEENGDINGDGTRDVSDAVALLNWLFGGGPKPVACASEPASEKFARSVAGTFLACTTGDVEIRSLGKINADGTNFAHLSNTFKGGGLGRFLSPAMGKWEQTGPSETTHTYLIFGYDEEGAMSFFERLVAVVTWKKDFSGWSGTWTAAVFEPTALQCGDAAQNPEVDPMAQPTLVASGSIRGGRI